MDSDENEKIEALGTRRMDFGFAHIIRLSEIPSETIFRLLVSNKKNELDRLPIKSG